VSSDQDPFEGNLGGGARPQVRDEDDDDWDEDEMECGVLDVGNRCELF